MMKSVFPKMSFFICLLALLAFSQISSACNFADLTLISVSHIGSGQYELNLTFCTGGGQNATNSGADQNTGSLKNGWSLGPCAGSNAPTTIDKGIFMEDENVASNLDFGMRVMPTIVSQSLHVDYFSAENEQVNIRLFDLSGRLINTIYSGSINSGENYNWQVETTEMEAGIYFANLRSSRGKAENVKMR